MNPTKSYQKQILELIEKSGGISAKKIREKLQISEPTVFKHLKRLIESGLITKLGRPPKVFYQKIQTQISPSAKKDFQENLKNTQQSSIKPAIQAIIEDNFLYITPEGKIFDGWKGFEYWCYKQKLDINKTAFEYFQTFQKYEQYKQKGLIDASFKLQESFEEICLDQLFYLDFYAIERFGKTKLAQLSFQAKQSQDRRLIEQIVKLVKQPIINLIEEQQVQAVAFIPPTVDRKIQFQTVLKESLNLPIPHLNLIKLILDTPVQQKTLKSKDDRILNASTTIFVDDERVFKNILLIDDFVGSGSTLNETAKKIKQKKLATKKLLGLALTGSFKGFEVVSQM